MKKANKFTFKTIKPTGKFRTFDNEYNIIKLDGKMVGGIHHSAPFNVRLMVYKKDLNEDGNPNCEWKWITLAKKSETIEETKEFVNNNFETLNSKYNLYKSE